MKTKKKSKSSAEYWREREEKQRKKNIKDEKEYSKEIDKIYRQMMDEIEVQINDFYTRYAGKEGITYAQAKERVSKLDIERYAELAKKYVAEKNFSKKANDEMRLYNLTMKVNRLELLKANIGMRIVGGFDELQQFFDEKLTERTLDTFERQAGILGKTVFDNQRYAHAIVNASFHNATWSDRIWTHQDVLRNELGSLLSTGLIQGRNPKELARTLRKKVESSKYNANRLMITEMARVQTEAQKQSYEKNGFTKYTFHSLGTACVHCLSISGKTFDLSDMQPGVNAPPMHPNCRCSTSAAIERTDFGVSDEMVDKFDKWTETYDEHGLSWKDWLKDQEKGERPVFKAEMFGSAFVDSKHRSTSVRLSDMLNKKAPDVNDDILALYSKLGKLIDKKLTSKSKDFNIIEGKKAYVGYYAYSGGSKSGQMARIDLHFKKLKKGTGSGFYVTNFHEIGHVFDYLSGDGKGHLATQGSKKIKDAFASISSKVSTPIQKVFDDFEKERKAIEKRYNEDITAYEELNASLKNGSITYAQYSRKWNKLKSDSEERMDEEIRSINGGGITSLMDIYDAISGGNLRDSGKVSYGHGQGYYKDESNKAAETFAQYCTLSIMRPDFIELLREDKPDLVKAYEELVKEMVEKIEND